MADKLVIVEDDYFYRIQWYIADIGDMGTILGEENYKELKKMKKQLEENTVRNEDLDHVIVTVAILDHNKPEKDNAGFFWENKADAQTALKLAKTALKSFRSTKSWPEWAMKAVSAGWKPPKGWLP